VLLVAIAIAVDLHIILAQTYIMTDPTAASTSTAAGGPSAMSPPITADPATTATKPRKRFVGSSSRPAAKKGEGKARPAPRRVANLIPDEILNDKDLNEAMKGEL
jgi:2-(3-amino-3-carboxypropyl)histidine synthase